MRAWLRILLVACLSLSLPLQGWASASMALCAALHERATVAAAGTAAPAAHAQGDAASMPCHPADAHPADSRTADGDSVADLGQHHCSTCAACCAGAALPMAMPVIAAPAEPATVFVARTAAVAFFATDGPDRPPRR